MLNHRIVLVELKPLQADEVCIELTVRHGQCAMCHARLWEADEAIVLVRAHADGSFNMQRFCDDVCVAEYHDNPQEFGED